MVDDTEMVSECLYLLTKIAYEVTGKRSYLLIDEYDKIFMDAYHTEYYDEVRSFMTAVFSAALKGNQSLEKALLTGVMRISYESVFSGLNNIVTFDVFNDTVYTDDYGFTDAEIETLNKIADFDIDKIRQWYNGVKINGHAIYNTYSVMSFLSLGSLSCFWGKSGTMELIANLMNDSRRETLAKLLNGERAEVTAEKRISLQHLTADSNDQAFYSLLIQCGYLAFDGSVPNKIDFVYVTVPNMELKIVWKEFVLSYLYSKTPQVRTLFDNANNLDMFSRDIEYFLSDRLSYYDLSGYKDEGAKRAQERIYHVFVLGILSAYDDVRYRYPLSNRESGDGRYDILIEKPNAYFIFEFKVCVTTDDLSNEAKKALTQIETKRYGSDLDSNKRLVKVGVLR
jgi:hypothetical protein